MFHQLHENDSSAKRIVYIVIGNQYFDVYIKCVSVYLAERKCANQLR